LTVADDGRGFDPDAVRGEEHRGLRNLRERVAEIGGTLSLQSAPGTTTIGVRVPARG
jgi:signal transduction histidine kinase